MTTVVLAVAYYLLSFGISIGAQELDPVKNMCVRFDHQSVFKNGTLYIDGGKETFIDVDDTGQQVGNITKGYNEYLIAIDMSKSWDWKTNISEVALSKTANPRTGTTPPMVCRGALYHGANDDNNIYLWGGTTSYFNASFPGFQTPTTRQYSLWSYNVVTKSWDQYDVTFGSPNRPNSGSFADATERGLSFFFNGVLDSGSELQTQNFGQGTIQHLEGMIVIDTNHQTVRNLSTKAVVCDMPRARGSMQYVGAIGSRGILIQIGGYQQSIANHRDSFEDRNLVPMNEIDIFDISSYYNASTPNGTWYKQTTSGATPDPRVDFCLVLASAQDGTSHNVYMYGGRRNKLEIYDDLWVLSIPSFTWTKIYMGTSPRYGHTCHKVGNRSMITVGGAADFDLESTPCDWEQKGLGVFDMSHVTWGSVFDASGAAYEVPAYVTAVIGGDPLGGATMIHPVGGFNQSGLSALVGAPHHSGPASPTTTPSPSPSAFQSPALQPPASHSKHRTVIIVGGLVGTIALITLMASLGFVHRQRIWRHIVGGEWPLPEMDSDRRLRHEMLTRTLRRELPVEPTLAELWTSDNRDSENFVTRSGEQEPGPRRLSPVVSDVKPASPSPIEMDARPSASRSTNTSDSIKPVPSAFGSSDRGSRTQSPNRQKPETKSPLPNSISKNAVSPPALNLPKVGTGTLRRSPAIRRPKPLEGIPIPLNKSTLELHQVVERLPTAKSLLLIQPHSARIVNCGQLETKSETKLEK